MIDSVVAPSIQPVSIGEIPVTELPIDKSLHNEIRVVNASRIGSILIVLLCLSIAVLVGYILGVKN